VCVVQDNVRVVVILCSVGSSISMRTVTVGAEGSFDNILRYLCVRYKMVWTHKLCNEFEI
jgi:hypothetical protein